MLPFLLLSVPCADIVAFSDWPTIPQLYVNGEFVGGCDILLNSTCPALVCSSTPYSRRLYSAPVRRASRALR